MRRNIQLHRLSQSAGGFTLIELVIGMMVIGIAIGDAH